MKSGKRGSNTGVFRTRSLRTTPIAASKDEHDETKQLHMTSRLNNCYL